MVLPPLKIIYYGSINLLSPSSAVYVSSKVGMPQMWVSTYLGLWVILNKYTYPQNFVKKIDFHHQVAPDIATTRI